MEGNEEIDQEGLIEGLMKNNDLLNNKNIEMSSAMSNMGMMGKKDENLIQYQIDTVELLDRLEHFYRGEYISFDKNGNQIWKKPTDKDQIPLNEYGVSSLMEIVSKYIDKNTTLSYYSEMRIYEILADLGDEMVLFILSNYEKIGMDTNFKKTKFRLIVVTTLHVIESTYRRSISGRTLEEMNRSTIVTQSDMLGARNLVPNIKPSKGGIRRLFGF